MGGVDQAEHGLRTTEVDPPVLEGPARELPRRRPPRAGPAPEDAEHATSMLKAHGDPHIA